MYIISQVFNRNKKGFTDFISSPYFEKKKYIQKSKYLIDTEKEQVLVMLYKIIMRKDKSYMNFF